MHLSERGVVITKFSARGGSIAMSITLLIVDNRL